MLAAALAWAEPSESAEPSAASPADGAEQTRYVLGVRVDWFRLQVELDARVVLREGLLELLACSPNTREHESILVTPARPRDVYHAMGLVGLTPGSPVHFDSRTGAPVAPSGERLQLHVRCGTGATETTVAAHEWLLDVGTQRPLEAKAVEWVFAGSRNVEDGRFAADLEGTVVCVVDFDTALIAPASIHTADNDQLWVAANPARIPEVDTRCSLLIRSATDPSLMVTLTADGRLHRGPAGGSALSPADLVRELGRKAGGAAARVQLRLDDGVKESTVTEAQAALRAAGVPESSIRVVRRGSRRVWRPGGR